MGAVDATFSALQAVYTADSGSGGLSGTGNAKITTFKRDTDAMESPAGVSCLVRVTPARSYDNRSDAMTLMTVQFEVTVERAQGFTRADAIRDRLKTKYNGQTLSASGGYSFSPAVWRQSQDVARDTKRIIVETYELLAFTTGSAPYLGTDAAFSGYSGGTCFYWELTEVLPWADDTTPTSEYAEFVAGYRYWRGQAKFYATAAPPAAGSYTGVFTLKSGVTKTGTICTQEVRTIAQLGQQQAQIVEVPFLVSGGMT